MLGQQQKTEPEGPAEGFSEGNRGPEWLSRQSPEPMLMAALALLEQRCLLEP
jgi:hypothetical protein